MVFGRRGPSRSALGPDRGPVGGRTDGMHGGGPMRDGGLGQQTKPASLEGLRESAIGRTPLGDRTTRRVRPATAPTRLASVQDQAGVSGPRSGDRTAESRVAGWAYDLLRVGVTHQVQRRDEFIPEAGTLRERAVDLGPPDLAGLLGEGRGAIPGKDPPNQDAPVPRSCRFVARGSRTWRGRWQSHIACSLRREAPVPRGTCWVEGRSGAPRACGSVTTLPTWHLKFRS